MPQNTRSDKHDPIKRWSTANVPQDKRLDYFVSAIDAALYPIGLDSADPRTFRAEVSFAELGSIGISKVTGSPHINFRGKKEIARSGDHRYILLMMLRGSLNVDHRGPLRMSPRDVLNIDSNIRSGSRSSGHSLPSTAAQRFRQEGSDRVLEGNLTTKKTRLHAGFRSPGRCTRTATGGAVCVKM